MPYYRQKAAVGRNILSETATFQKYCSILPYEFFPRFSWIFLIDGEITVIMRLLSSIEIPGFFWIPGLSWKLEGLI